MVDIVIVTVIGAAVAGIFWKKVRDHKSGKGNCGCGNRGECGGCPSGGACHR